jgi:hypothetical protein
MAGRGSGAAVTRKERAQYRREYPDKYFLLPAEMYPRDEFDPPSPFDQVLLSHRFDARHDLAPGLVQELLTASRQCDIH